MCRKGTTGKAMDERCDVWNAGPVKRERPFLKAVFQHRLWTLSILLTGLAHWTAFKVKRKDTISRSVIGDR